MLFVSEGLKDWLSALAEILMFLLFPIPYFVFLQEILTRDFMNYHHSSRE